MRRIIAISVLLLGLAAAVNAQEVLQTFNVSKKSPGANGSPAVAYNEKKGHVGAVWIHANANNGLSEVWFSLLKLTSDGSLRVKKTQKISEGAVRVTSPTIVYNEDDNEFLAAWVSANPANAAPANEDKIDVTTCRISARGKVLSLAVIYTTIVIAQYFNPILYYMHEALVGPEAARFMLFFGCRGALGGLYLMYLDALGHALGSPIQAMVGEFFNGQHWEITPDSIVAGPGNAIIIGITIWAFLQNGQFNPRTALISMTGLGVILHTLVLQATYSANVRILPLSATLLLAAWWSFETQSYVMRRVLFPELIFTAALLSPLKSGSVQLWTMLFIAVAANSYYLFGSEFGNKGGFAPAGPNDWIYARRIRDNGKATGKDMQMFSHQGRLTALTGVGLSKGNEDAKRWPVLLIWQKFISRDNQEIRGVVIQP